jgi:hypothetical protein
MLLRIVAAVGMNPTKYVPFTGFSCKRLIKKQVFEFLIHLNGLFSLTMRHIPHSQYAKILNYSIGRLLPQVLP